MTRFYVTTAIPYVNAEPHLGHALELVQADVLARHRRLRGQPVRYLSGTDDNALKNVTAARAAGVPVRDFVDANAARFAALRGPLDLSFDDFIRTSEERHRRGVERLWRQCAERGDFYRRRYEGLYCLGCEQFYVSDELAAGLCPEHGVRPETVSEENWFFRLSRYQEAILEALVSGRVRVEPTARRNEMLAFVRAGLADFSVSRPAERAGGWGIPIPDDPDQVVYVWWDALANYITALDYGSPTYAEWWANSGERVHVIGKGILRFHAVYWLGLLLSIGQPLPTTIFVHEYLTVNGEKISKSVGNAIDPVELAQRFGVDAVRWWLLSEVARVGDTDFTVDRLVRRANTDLANGIGNLVNRTVAMVHRYRSGRVPASGGSALDEITRSLPRRVDAGLAAFDFRAAAGELLSVVDAGNRFIESVRPWELARRGAADELDAVLHGLIRACRVLAGEVSPFVPGLASRIRAQLGGGDRVEKNEPAFARLETP